MISSNSSNNTGPSVPMLVPPIKLQWLIIGVLTGLTNASLLLFIAFHRKLHNITNFILCSKLLLGFFFGVFYVIPRQGIPALRNVIVLCDVIPQVGNGLMVNLNLHVCLISFHRYFFIINPFGYKERATPRNVSLVVGSTWLLSIFIAIIPFFTFRPINITKCVPVADIIAETIYLSTVFIILFLIPLIVLVATYGKILVVVLSLHHDDIYPVGEKLSIMKVKTNRKALVQAAVMIGIFFCLFVPFVIGVIIFFFALQAGNVASFIPFLTATQYPAFCYPTISPFLNILFMGDIRVEVVQFARSSYSVISGENNSFNIEASPQAQRRRKTLTSTL